MEKRNVSIAKSNGYTLEKVLKAKQYIEEIGSNKRNFPFKKLVEYYNELTGMNDSPSGCSCQSPKYYNAIQNYYKYGKLTLINSGKASEEDFILKQEEVEPIAENRINLGIENEGISEPSDEVSEDNPNNVKEEENEEIVEAKKKAGRPKKNK